MGLSNRKYTFVIFGEVSSKTDRKRKSVIIEIAKLHHVRGSRSDNIYSKNANT